MKKSILVIDDDPYILDFYKIVLAELGEVRVAENLPDARQQLVGVDLILLDFYLAKDGDLIQDVVPELRKTAPVLLCSGIQDISVPSLAAELGVAGYWNKGSKRETLISLVKSVLGS